MAGRPGLDQIEEGKSFSALFVLMIAVLLVTAIWSIWDDNISRRPWKQYQVEFDRLAYNKYMRDVAAEQKKLDADPEYVKDIKELGEANRQLNTGETQRQLDGLESQEVRLKNIADDKDQAVRFTKSMLTERMYDYNHAIQTKEDPAPIWADIQKLQNELAGENAVSDKAKKDLQDVKDQIDKINSRVADLTDKLKVMTKTRDDLSDKADTWMIPVKLSGHVVARYPKIPKIQQTAIDDYDRNAFDEAIARVDRCQSCHMGADKKGFEDAPQPFRTHSNFDAIILKHPPEKTGCTPCHDGQGPAVNSITMAHGNEEHWEHPLLMGDEMQARCITCHIDVGSLRNKDNQQIALQWVNGERMFQQMGCPACHLVGGYEDTQKIGPYLKVASAKLDPSWAVRWIMNPHEFRPHTRMPNFMFSTDQATQIAAYIFDSSQKEGDDWSNAHAAPAELKDALTNSGLVEEGKGIFESVGCKGCHSIDPGQFGTPVGSEQGFKPDQSRTAKDFAPNLSNIAEKTDARWLYWWIKDPTNYSPHTAMPSLRLSDHEALALTAFLMQHGQKKPDPNVETALKDPDNIKKGEALVRKYGCFGCHEINGMEHESRIGVELTTEGSKHVDELFFGNHTDIPETWNDWMYNKLHDPRTYATKDVEQVMPNFDLQDQDIKDIRVFLASLHEGKVQERYRMPGSSRQEQIVMGRRDVNFRNCVGCHIIEDRGGFVRRFYPPDQINLAPPILNGEGAKVQPEWLFSFLQSPTPIRPWLKIRMPTFHVDNHEGDTLVDYFTSMADLQVPFVYLNTNLIPAADLEAGAKLMTKDYFNCFSCHQQGDKHPEGPSEGWAPDLGLAHARLNPEWIPVWLKDPQKIQPGTKMPSFYPGGPDDILKGNEDEQRKALRDYIFWFGTHPGQTLPSQVASPQQAPKAEAPKKLKVSEGNRKTGNPS
jgi:mono/diheme cytochrome c family protein